MKPLLLLPVENQVREMDAKLLFASLAAEEGYTTIIGWKQLIDRRIGRFPPSVYFAKSITQRNTKMLRIKRKIGHFVIAWDEEAVVHYPQDIYYARRIGEEALTLVDLLVAWGEDNKALLLGHPACRPDAVRVFGNPRADLLRPEMRELWAPRAQKLNRAYGDFILVNTNFGSVNGYMDTLNLMRQEVPGGAWIPGRGALGMPPDYAQGLFSYRSQVFHHFQKLLPKLAQAFPDRKIILRPHPAEDHKFWRTLLAGHSNIEIIAEGNVIPWLIASDCLVHNGCTTAIEGFLLGTRIVSFVPEDDDRYEFQLPNQLGVRCRDENEVIAAIAAPDDDPGSSGGREQLVRQFIHNTDDELAATRVLSAVPDWPPQGMGHRPVRILGILNAEIRSMKKRLKGLTGVARYSDSFMRQRFPHLDLETVQERVDQLQRITNGKRKLHVHRLAEDLFKVSAK